MNTHLPDAPCPDAVLFGGLALLGLLSRPLGYIFLSIAGLLLIDIIASWRGVHITLHSPITFSRHQQRVTTSGQSSASLQPVKKDMDATTRWLLSVLASNRQYVYTAVNGRILGWRFSGINSPDPYFEIALEEVSTSIFTLHFIGGSGPIFVDGTKCQQPPTTNEQRGLTQGDTFQVTVEQAVSKDVADIIRAASNNKQNVRFDLRQFHLHFETTTKGYEGLKPLIKFDREFEVQPNTNTTLLVLHKAEYRI